MNLRPFRSRTVLCATALGLAAIASSRASFIPGSEDDPYGTMTIDGGLNASRGMGLDIIIGDSGQSNSLTVIGEAAVGGEIRITLAPHINPYTDYHPGDSFILMTATTITSGYFQNLPWDTPVYGDGDSLPRGPRWMLAKKRLGDKPGWAVVLQVVE